MPSRFTEVRLSPWKGLNIFENKYRLSSGDMVDATNILSNTDGSVERVNGYTDILAANLGTAYCTSIYEFETWDGSLYVLFSNAGSVYKINTDWTTATALITGLSDSKKVGFTNYNNYCYFGNGFDENKVLRPNDNSVVKMGITPPSVAMTLGQSGAAGLANGTYLYYYTFYNTTDGVESAPSPQASITVAGGPRQVDISVITADATSPLQTTHKRIYRTTVGGATFYRVNTVTNATTTYTDTTADASLGATCTTEGLSVFPNTNILITYQDRVYCAGNYIDPAFVYYSDAFYPHRYFAATHYQAFDIAITAMAKCDNGLIVFEKHKTWLWSSPPFGSAPYLVSNEIGCVNQDALCYVDNDLLFLSLHGVYAFNGGSLKLLSQPVNTGLMAKNLSSAAMVYDAYNKRAYVAVASA